MNINYAQVIVVLTVLACVLPANCAKNVQKSSSKSDTQIKNASSESNLKNDENSSDGKKVETMLLNIATIIQRCVDNKTMNNKDFKAILDNLYKNLIKPIISKSLKKYKNKVISIKKKYEEDVGLLKIMNTMPDSGSNKNKDNPSKKSGKK